MIRRRIHFSLFLILLGLSVLGQGEAAISTATAWEVRASVGSDSNGGGFVTGATGTDFSQQNAAQYTFTNLASSNGSTNPCIVSSASHNFVSTDVGNIMQITAGTSWTTGFYQIVSVATNNATLDRACGSAASLSSGTFAVGGALATIAKALTANTTGNIIFVKATATYSITAGLTLNSNQTPSNALPPSQLIGYTTTRTDAGRATIQLSTNANLTAINGTSQAGWNIRNFVIDCNTLTNSTGVILGFYTTLHNAKVQNCTTVGASAAGSSDFASIQDSEFTGMTSGAASNGAITFNLAGGSILRNYIHDNTCPGIVTNPSGGLAIGYNVIANNSGASSDGVQVSTAARGIYIYNNTIYNNGRDGIFVNTSDLVIPVSIRNNLLANNARYGINGGAAAGAAAYPWYDGNAYFSNATAARNNMDDTGTTNPINAAAPYTNTLDVILTAAPFTNTATHDFTRNSTAGGGAAARGTATPGALPGLSQSGAMSFGALQPAASAAVTQSGQAFTQ